MKDKSTHSTGISEDSGILDQINKGQLCCYKTLEGKEYEKAYKEFCKVLCTYDNTDYMWVYEAIEEEVNTINNEKNIEFSETKESLPSYPKQLDCVEM